jgi:hypothetical protein
MRFSGGGRFDNDASISIDTLNKSAARTITGAMLRMEGAEVDGEMKKASARSPT